MPSVIPGTALLLVVFTIIASVVLGFPLAIAVGMALAAVVLHVFSDIWHQAGHALAARTTGYPMIGIRLWWVLAASVYPSDEPDLPPGIHIRRALGGPIASAILSLIAGLVLLAMRAAGPATWVVGWWFAENLLLFTAQVLIPFGFNDGATIWHWMRVPRSDGDGTTTTGLGE
jgi:hypothetical protein